MTGKFSEILFKDVNFLIRMAQKHKAMEFECFQGTDHIVSTIFRIRVGNSNEKWYLSHFKVSGHLQFL